MRNYLSIFLTTLFFISNQASAYEIKRSISDLEKMLKEEIYHKNCRGMHRVYSPIIILDREDIYKMNVLIKHNPKNFKIKEIKFLNDINNLKDGLHGSKEEKKKVIFDQLVYQLKTYCGTNYPISIKTYNKYNISEYIFDYELNSNKNIDFQIRLTDKDVKYISDNKDEIASSKKEIKRFEIYDNFPHNWTLFGTKLYGKVDNLDIIGKFVIYEIKENEKKNNYEFQCVSARTLDDKPLIIDTLTDSRGCVIGNNIDFGLTRYAQGYTSDHHYLIRPAKNNESFSIFIVRYSPLEKRILSITAKSKASFENDDNCIDVGNQILDNLYESFISTPKNYKITKELVAQFGKNPLVKNIVRIYLEADPKEFYDSEEDKMNALFGVYGFACIDDKSSNPHFYVYLTDAWRSLKIVKEGIIIEENEKILNEKKLGKDIKDDIL